MSLEHVNEIFSELTLTRKERTLPLAKLAFEKARGNPFFTLQFIHILQQREVFYFSTTTYKFEWNLESARKHTQLADNAVEAVRERMAAFLDFDPDDRELMTIASYLGKSFHVDDVTYVKHTMDSLNKTTTTSLVEAVNIATLAASRLVVVEGRCRGDTTVFEKMIEEQLLESVRIGKYKFSHDSIHHFFLSKEESAGWKGTDYGLRVGTAILVLARTRPSRNSVLLFSAVNVLNEGIDSVFDNQSKIFLASLNLEVAEMAAEKSAFFSSTP